MKKYIKFTTVFLFLSFLIHTSCNNDDQIPPPENGVEDTNGAADGDTDEDSNTDDTDTDNTDGSDDGQQNSTADYLALKALYEANPDNTLGWDLDDSSMESWAGVALQNGRVVSLVVGGVMLKEIPDEIGNLTQLDSLKLTDNDLVEFPSAIGNLKELRYFDVSSNALKEIPVEIGELSQLKLINTSSNLLEKVPSSIGNLTELEALNLELNAIETIPQVVCDLLKYGTILIKDKKAICEGTKTDYEALKALYEANSSNLLNWGDSIDDSFMSKWEGVTLTDERVTKIELFSKEISDLVPELGNIEKLVELKVNGNDGLERLPNEIGNLVNLEVLYLQSNAIQKLPETIGNLVNLEILFLDGNSIEVIPETIGNLVNLEKLQLNRNSIEELPEAIGQLIRLQELTIEYNNLTGLPHSIGNLKSLWNLNVRGNTGLLNIPDELGALAGNLKNLNFSSLDLQEIPSVIYDLHNLKDLTLGYNGIGSIESDIKNLTNLKFLDLFGNQIEELPLDLRFLTKLQVMNIASNELKTVPAELAVLEIIWSLGGNPLSDGLPPEICNLNPTLDFTQINAGICQ